MAGKSKPPAIGIDLGNTYSCVAVLRRDRVEIIPNDEGNHVTPSYVVFNRNTCLVGDVAKDLAGMNPTSTVFGTDHKHIVVCFSLMDGSCTYFLFSLDYIADAKKLIGRMFSDPFVQVGRKLWPFKVICGANDKPLIILVYNGLVKQFSPEEIYSMILTKIKEMAEAFLGFTVKEAVITVPASFHFFQKKATKDAAAISGLHVLDISTDPVAAAIAYGLDKKYSNTWPKNVLIFDLGGGSLNVSLLTLVNGIFQIQAIGGDNVGGEDFDNRMVNYLLEEFKKRHKDHNIRNNPRSLERLRTACERAKWNLSSLTETTISIDCLFNGIDFDYILTRVRFEKINMDLFEKCIVHVKRCLKDAKMEKGNIQDVVLVGGSSRIPKVQQLLQDFFNGKELCKSIHPEEVVAHGAAIQAANLSDGVTETVQEPPLSLHATPLSLGMRINDDEMCVIIPKNTLVPTRKETMRTTSYENQTSLLMELYVGERPRARDNILLGTFVLYGILLAPRGVPKIEVCFDIDVNGILTVSAEDKTTGKKNSMTINNFFEGMLSEDHISKMLKDAERFKLEDEEHKKKFKAKNSLKNYVYNTRTSITTQKLVLEKMEEEVKFAIEWLNEHKDGKRKLFHNKKEELQKTWDPIISKF
ncbi:heat shock cognate 70 kDa protein 2-like [Henckelia pumila]|uniref:heat shock cognate 70 kDa protein 2-like n=1 Tax=Henckelia pumila TaxID=405737 RepID=UPI003C6E42D0